MPFKFTGSGGSKRDWFLSPRSGETASETKEAVICKIKALRFHGTLQEIRFTLLHREQDPLRLSHLSVLLFTLPHESMFDPPVSLMASYVCIQSQHGSLVFPVCLAFSGSLFWGLQTSSVPKSVLTFETVPGFINHRHCHIKCCLWSGGQDCQSLPPGSLSGSDSALSGPREPGLWLEAVSHFGIHGLSFSQGSPVTIASLAVPV